jgi:hypothetical protein
MNFYTQYKQPEPSAFLKAVCDDPSLIGIYSDWLEEHGFDFGFERAISELVSLGYTRVWLALKPAITVHLITLEVSFWDVVCLDFTTLLATLMSGWDVNGPLVCEDITTCVGTIGNKSKYSVYYNRPLNRGRVFQLLETHFTDARLWTLMRLL